MHAEVEVASGGAAAAMLAFPGHAYPRAVVHARGIRTSTLRVWPSCFTAKRRVAP